MDVCLGIASGAARGRTVVVLEGGYGLPALAQAGAAVVKALLGERPAPVASVDDRPPSTRWSASYRRALEPFWPVLGA